MALQFNNFCYFFIVWCINITIIKLNSLAYTWLSYHVFIFNLREFLNFVLRIDEFF